MGVDLCRVCERKTNEGVETEAAADTSQEPRSGSLLDVRTKWLTLG